MPKKLEIAFKYRDTDIQVLTNDDDVCIPRLSSILIATIEKKNPVHWQYYLLVDYYFSIIANKGPLYIMVQNVNKRYFVKL